MTRHLADGVHLNVEELGPSARPPLVLLHGFTGSTESWRPFAAAFASTHRPIAIDLLGHGLSDSPKDPDCFRAEAAVRQLLALFDRLGLPGVDLVGYSMGGRVALQLAAAAPDRIRRLILESASPGIVDPGERAARVQSDRALADLAERHGIESFVDRWERIPLFASQARLPEEVRAVLRARRLRNDPRGLANSLRGFGAGVPEPLWARLPTLPTLVVVGALDRKYCAIGREMVARMPEARLEVVPDAGHTVHLEQPDRFRRLVTDFLGG